jgi:hypothetical protein
MEEDLTPVLLLVCNCPRDNGLEYGHILKFTAIGRGIRVDASAADADGQTIGNVYFDVVGRPELAVLILDQPIAARSIFTYVSADPRAEPLLRSITARVLL